MYESIRYFYHITHIDNIKSILNDGLFSKNYQKTVGIKSNSILDKHNTLKNVNVDNKNCDGFINHSEKRDIIKLNGFPLNNYVPLYFNPECAILNIDRSIEHEFTVICINKDILDTFQDVAYFSDGIPTNTNTQFFKYKSDLNNIDWDELLVSYNHSKCFEGLNSLMPEVLIEDKIQSNKIEKIICGNNKVYHQLKNIIGNKSSIKVEENRRIYFMSGYSMETEHIFNLK